MIWTVEYTKEAQHDLDHLDRSQQLQVLKAIEKVSANPLPASEGGFGKPLGNHATSKLAGYQKIKIQKFGLRIVYTIVREATLMRVIIISIRDDETVYQLAQKRIK